MLRCLKDVLKNLQLKSSFGYSDLKNTGKQNATAYYLWSGFGLDSSFWIGGE
jgi:hypothetical protein